LYFDLFDHNVVTDDFMAFVAALLRRLGRGIILVMDRWQVHRSAARRLQKKSPKRVQIEWLPPYAPELNPTEQVWTQTKYRDLANYIPGDVTELGEAVVQSLRRTRGQQRLLRSFFKHADVTELGEAVVQSLRRTRGQQRLLRSFFKHAQLTL